MARKPNYRQDRIERDRKKEAKKAERLQARQGKAADANPSDEPPATALGPDEAEASPAVPDVSPPPTTDR